MNDRTPPLIAPRDPSPRPPSSGSSPASIFNADYRKRSASFLPTPVSPAGKLRPVGLREQSRPQLVAHCCCSSATASWQSCLPLQHLEARAHDSQTHRERGIDESSIVQHRSPTVHPSLCIPTTRANSFTSVPRATSREKTPATCTRLSPRTPTRSRPPRTGPRHRVQDLGLASPVDPCYIGHLHTWGSRSGSIRLADRELKRDYSSNLGRESSTGQAFLRSDRAGFQARMTVFSPFTPSATHAHHPHTIAFSLFTLLPVRSTFFPRLRGEGAHAHPPLLPLPPAFLAIIIL